MKKLLTVVLTLLVAGCATVNSPQYTRKDPHRGSVVQPQELASIGLHRWSPVMLRIIKEDRVLELWKLNKEGEYIKAKTYEICAVSGTLGPKKKQGDRQGPEGFYEITSSSLNPSSVEYLSFDTGYPNARDRAHNYSGSALMVHGGCSSAGCYAITDPSMDEVYSAVRDALAGGQRSVQLQIYPFRMTAWRMLAEKKNPNYEFWKELKAGWDKFEQTTRPLIVDVKGGRYVIR